MIGFGAGWPLDWLHSYFRRVRTQITSNQFHHRYPLSRQFSSRTHARCSFQALLKQRQKVSHKFYLIEVLTRITIRLQ